MPRRSIKCVMNCDYCGQEILRSKAYLERGSSHLFCSSTCHGKWFSENGAEIFEKVAAGNRGRMPWNKGELVPIECASCGTIFEVWPAHSDMKYCSRDCYAAYLRTTGGETHPSAKPPVIFNCATCGIEFKVQPHRASTARYCSIECTSGRRVSGIEAIVAKELTRRNVVFDAQKKLGSFYPDFTVGQIIIEVDGDYWHSLPETRARDIRKDVFYAEHGYAVIRITEHEVRAEDFSKLDALVAAWEST